MGKKPCMSAQLGYYLGGCLKARAIRCNLFTSLRRYLTMLLQNLRAPKKRLLYGKKDFRCYR